MLNSIETTKAPNYIQLKVDTYPYNFLAATTKPITALKSDLSEMFDADIIIKTDCYEIKRRPAENILKPITNEEWLNKVNQYLEVFKANKFNEFVISNQTFQLSQSDWDKIINMCLSRYSLTESIKLEIISNQNEQQKCLITGVKELVNKEKSRIETEVKALIEKERKKTEKKTYNLDTLNEVQCKILKNENLCQWCRDNCSPEIEIKIETKNVYFKGAWDDIEKAKARVWDIINSTKEDVKRPLNIHLIEFLETKTDYLFKFQQENNLSCYFEFHTDQISFRSIQPVADRFIHLLNTHLKVESIDLIDASLKLFGDGKFNTFVKNLENDLKTTNESNLFLITSSISEKKVFITGVKLIVDRLVIDIKDFFDSNTIVTKFYNENEIDLFSHENVKYLKVVKTNEINDHLEQIKQQFKILKPFQILEDNNNKDQIKKYQIKFETNKRTHDFLISFLKNLIDTKRIDYFAMSDEKLEVFMDSKMQTILETVEDKFKCVIFSPRYLDILKNNETKSPTIPESDKSNTKSEEIINYFTCYLTIKANEQIKINVIDCKHLQSLKLDTLIISIDNEFQGLNNVSKEILKEAGVKIYEELQQLAKSEYNNNIYDGILFLTKSSTNLNTQSIIHCVNPIDSVELDYLTAMIYKCLEKCEQRNYKRIGLNLIGSSCYNNLTSADIIKLHLQTLTEYFLDPSVDSCIKEIYLVDNKLNPILISSLNQSNSFSLKESNKSEQPKPAINKVEPKKQSTFSIKIIYGSITDDNLKCDCIVNSTNTNLTLNSGLISANILKMAGNSIQTELAQNYPQGLKNQLVAISTAGNLKNKKNIFHCCIPAYADPNMKQLYKNIIYSLLNEAIRLNLKSIAFPAFGSGNLNYPKQEVPKLMFKTINQYFNEKNSKIQIFIVVYENDKETVKAFKEHTDDSEDENEDDKESMHSDNDSLAEFKQKESDDSDSEFTNEKTFYRNFKSNDQLNECKIELENVLVKAYIGDITKSTNDVIFNPSDNKFNLDGNISKSLIKFGGNQISTELNNKSNTNGLAWTSGGSLACKKIIHVDVRTNNAKTAIILALNEINESNYQSVTLPVIGTGNLGNDPKESIKNILDAIAIYISIRSEEKKIIKIKRIDICIFNQQDYLKTFKSEMEKRLKSKCYKDEEPGILNKMLNFIKPQTSSTDHFKQLLGGITATNKHENKKFRLIAENKDAIELTKKRLEEIAQDEIKTEELKNDYIKKLNSKDREKIEVFCKKEFTKLEWDIRLSRILLIGRPKNIFKCFGFIMNVISQRADEIASQLSAELTAHSIQWEYKKGDKWQPFNIYLNNEIEKKYSIKSKSDYKFEYENNKNETCIVDVENLIQFKKLNSTKQTQIRRNEIDKTNTTIRFPETWTQNKELDLIDLDKNNKEFKEVLKQIENSGFSISSNHFQRVVSIQRIQNKRLFIQYQTHKEEFCKKYASITYERTLFHGTNEDCVEKIWKNGFNRSYAGKNATMYGKGC